MYYRPVYLVTIILIWARTSLSLVTLPNNLRAFSQYLHSTSADNFSIYDIEEFQDLIQGSTRLMLDDYLDNHVNPIVSYFRLNEQGLPSRPDPTSSIGYNPKEKICTLEDQYEWPLKGLSIALERLQAKSREEDAQKHYFTPINDTKSRRLSLGPAGLLRLIYENANLFELDGKAYNDGNLLENYYFATKLQTLTLNKFVQCFVRVVVAFPARSFSETLDTKRLDIKRPTLSQVDTREHPSLVGIFQGFTDEDKMFLSESTASDLFDTKRDRIFHLERVLIMFNLIQSHADQQHHLGQLSSASIKSFEMNPFLLPMGYGCGLLQSTDASSSGNNDDELASSSLLFVRANQFSGRFNAQAYRDQFFIAYDEESNHLRYDSVGEFKLVYSLNERLATMINTKSMALNAQLMNEIDTGDNVNNMQQREQKNFQQSEHCAQISIYELRDEDILSQRLFSARSMEHLLGFGANVGLAYLGNEILEDDLVARVYEREVSYANIPVLLLMHTFPMLKPSDRFFLQYYMIPLTPRGHDNDADTLTKHNYQSLWLRRVTLTANNDFATNFLLSELTFEEFSWSLSVVAGGDSGESSIEDDAANDRMHPSRTFDTLECSSQNDQSRLEFKLEQTDESDWKFGNGTASGDNDTLRHQFINQLDIFETKLAYELMEKTQLPRSKLNELLIHSDFGQADSFLASLIVTRPLLFEYSHSVIGWLLQADSVTKATDSTKLPAGEIIKRKASISLLECSMRLASEMDRPTKIYMLHCPNIGCGYIRSFKWDQVKDMTRLVDGPNTKPPSLKQYSRMCSVHLLSRRTASMQKDTYYSQEKLILNLRDQLVSIPMRLNRSSDESTSFEDSTGYFKASIRNVQVRSNLHHQQWDWQIIEDQCFTTHSRLVANKNFADRELINERINLTLNIQLVQLDFDKHHSVKHCHLACIQLAHCSSYSYSTLTHQCTLSNLEPDTLLKPEIELENTIEEKHSCKIYALNQILRYEPKSSYLLMEPTTLLQTGKPLFVVSQQTCSSLCHRNEFNAPNGKNKTRCLRFIYIQANSLCFLLNEADDVWSFGRTLSQANYFNYSDNLIDQETAHGMISNLDELKSYLGIEEEIANAEYSQIYERNYRECFVSKSDKRLNLNEPKESFRVDGQLGLDSKRLNITSLEGCLQECAIVDQYCLAFDFYVKPVLIGTHGATYEYNCHLYHFRSPFSFETNLMNASSSSIKFLETIEERSLINGMALDEFEWKIYSPAATNYSLKVIQSTGWHYYMTGDQLHLRQMILNAPTNSNIDWPFTDVTDESISQPSSRIHGNDDDHKLNETRDSSSFISLLIRLAIGFPIGFLVVNNTLLHSIFIRPSIGQTTMSTATLIDWIANMKQSILQRLDNFTSGSIHQRDRRSMSQVHLDVELNQI